MDDLRVKLSVLWVFATLNYLYADVFHLFYVVGAQGSASARVFCCSWLLLVAYGLCGEHGVRRHSRSALSWNSGTEECWLKSGDSESPFI